MAIGANTISIIGCGWFGLPLAIRAIQAGFKVKGSTTRKEKLSELALAGIDPYIMVLPAMTSFPETLVQSDLLVINLPPGRRNPNVLRDYPLAIKLIIDAAKKQMTGRKIIFISSTSVYGENHEFIDESTPVMPQTDSGKAVVFAEQLVADSGMNTIILRFGGLAGPGRHPGRFLAGRKELDSGDQAINFLHLDDAIAVVSGFLNGKGGNELYNVVAPEHPVKKKFYRKMAEMLGQEPPGFSDVPAKYRREISVNKLIVETGYNFQYPDPMHFRFNKVSDHLP